MAVQSLHRLITTLVMGRFHFKKTAQAVAADANAAVDEKQGNSPTEANQHAMCGKRDDGRLQSAAECHDKVKALRRAAKQEIVEHLQTGERKLALMRLGSALHTVQDLAFHNCEAWPYTDIVDAFRSDPNYMIAHGLRDLGIISKLDLRGLGRGGFDVDLSARVGRRTYLTYNFFNNPPPSRGWRDRGGRGAEMNESFRGAGMMLSLTIGTAPIGNVSTEQRLHGHPNFDLDTNPNVALALQGPAATARAEDASFDFIAEVKTDVDRVCVTEKMALAVYPLKRDTDRRVALLAAGLWADFVEHSEQDARPPAKGTSVLSP